MDSSITASVPNGSLGAGEAPSEKPSLAGGSGIVEEERAEESCYLRAKFNCTDQGNSCSCISLSSPGTTPQWGREQDFLIQ